MLPAFFNGIYRSSFSPGPGGRYGGMTLMLTIFQFLFLSTECRGDVQISSDFYFSLEPKNYTQMLLKEKFSGEETQIIPLWKIDGEYESAAENIRLQLKYDLQLQQDPNFITRFNYQMNFPTGQIDISKVSTNAVIIKNVGGVQATIYLKGECRDIHIETQGPLQFNGGLELSSKEHTLGALLRSIHYQNEQQWTMTVGDCQGPKGYRETLEKELRALLLDKEKMQSLLMRPFQEQVDKKIATLNEQLFSEKLIQIVDNVQVNLKPVALELNSQTGQILLRGLIKTDLKAQKTENHFVEAPFTDENLAQVSKSGFMISQKYIQRLMEELYSQGYMQQTYLAQQIPGLSTLFKNRLFQFFLWPDLMRFKTNSAFSFQIEPKKIPKLDFQKVHQGSAWFSLKSDLAIKTKTPKNYGSKDYGTFFSPFSSQAWMQVYNGRLAIGFHQPKTQLKFSWNQLYQKLSRPYQTISASFFGKKIESSLKNYRWSTELPTFQVGDVTSLKPKAIDSNGDWLLLEYVPAITSAALPKIAQR